MVKVDRMKSWSGVGVEDPWSVVEEDPIPAPCGHWSMWGGLGSTQEMREKLFLDIITELQLQHAGDNEFFIR